jgi:hypothetical protein
MATIELNATQIWLYTLIWGGFCGAVGWFANFGVSAYRIRTIRQHALDDAKDQRCRKFLGFLKPWAADVEANRPMTNANNILLDVAGRFDEKRLELVREAAQVESDFSDARCTKFKQLVDRIVNMRPGDVQDEDGRKILLEAIRALAAFVKAN